MFHSIMAVCVYISQFDVVRPPSLSTYRPYLVNAGRVLDCSGFQLLINLSSHHEHTYGLGLRIDSATL